MTFLRESKQVEKKLRRIFKMFTLVKLMVSFGSFFFVFLS